MNRSNFALEHQGEVSREPLGQDLPHLSIDITHDTRMPYGKLKVLPAVAHNYGMGKSFTNKELTKIILDKNEVIADLEKNAYGEGFWDDVRAGLVKHNERKKTMPISEDDWKKQMENYEKPTENWGADELDGGGAAPAAKPEPPSAVAAAAAALQPVRTAIQNGIGDAIYGKSDDPKKQKKGLLGISEEGKEESKKKVMKNIVVPVAKVAMGLKKGMEDTWNLMFNQDKYNADMKAERIKRIKKEEAEMGVVRDKTDPKLIVRKPRGLYKTETTDPEEEAYKPIAHRDGSAKAKEFMIRVPNPLFGIVKPTSKTLNDAGIHLWAGVNSFKDDDIDYSLRALQDDKFMWIPEEGAKELYGKLRQFAADEQDKELATGFEEFGWSKADMKQFAKIDPRTLKGMDLIEYKQAKLLEDKQVAKNALKKVTADIATEEGKEGKTLIIGERPVIQHSDQARLTKMRDAKARVEKRMADLEERGRQDFKDMTMWAEADSRRRDAEYYANQRANVEGAVSQEQADQAEFAALPAADRIAQLETYIAELQSQGAPEWQIDEYDQQIRAIEEEVEAEEETRQAQGSVELLQQAEVVGGEGSASDGEDSDDSIEEIHVIEVKVGKQVFLVDRGIEGALPVGNYKSAIKNFFFQNRRVYDPKTKDELGVLSDPAMKKVAMVVLKQEEESQKANLKKAMEPLRDSERERFAKMTPQQRKEEEEFQRAYDRVADPRSESESEGSVRGDGMWEDEAEMTGGGMVEFALAKSGKLIYNPEGDMTKAGRQTFTPDWDAYGEDVASGKRNAFNLSRSMYIQGKAMEVPGFKMVKDDTSLRFYKKDDENVILVGIRGTDVHSWTDLYTWAVIGRGVGQDLRWTTRYQEDLTKLIQFQRNYPPSQFYYVATGSSLAGSIADRFLELGIIEEAVTYNPSIEKKFILEENLLNHRIYLDTDPLFILMGQYAPNTEIRKNASRVDYYNPVKEKDQLVKSHSIYPLYNAAFEGGGGMEGGGKTYTIEEWKAIFDAKLEKKREQIEAREAKKKATAKAKRARAKERRDERKEIPDLETPAVFRTSRVMKATPPKAPEPEPEPESESEPEKEYPVTRYKMDGNDVYVSDMEEGVRFEDRVVVDYDDNQLGTLGTMKELAKKVRAKEKRAQKKSAPPAPATARVELREELVAEQPRTPEGVFAAEPLQLVVAEIERQPPRAYMEMLKSPKLTEADRRLMMNLQRSSMAPMRKAKLLARSGLARKLVELLGIDESVFQGQRARLRIADKMEKRVVGKKAREVALAPLMDLFDKQEAGLIRFLAKKTDKKDGESISRFVDYVAKKFADCAIGTWVVVAKMLSFGRSRWECDGRNDIIEKMGEHEISNGGSFETTATMFLTEADEKNVTCFGYMRGEPRFGLNFGEVQHAFVNVVNDEGELEHRVSPNKNFFFPEMTRACMSMVEKIDGVRNCWLHLKKAGMGYKRRREWSINCEEVEPVQKRLKREQQERISKKENEKAKEISVKVGALVTEYKDLILERGALMVERVEASLTPDQLAAIEAYEVKVSKPVVIAKKKKRLAEVESRIAAIGRIDISAMRYYLLDDEERRREDAEVAKISPLRTERDRLKREIANLEK